MYTIESSSPPRNEFSIPVYPHVKKFVIRRFRDPALPKGTTKVEEYSTLGKFVTLALREPASAEHNDQYRDRLTESITLILTSKQAGLSPRLSKLIRLNTDLDRVFKEHLISWIEALRAAGIPPYEACRLFLDNYSIDEGEYSREAAYRYYQRFKAASQQSQPPLG